MRAYEFEQAGDNRTKLVNLSVGAKRGAVSGWGFAMVGEVGANAVCAGPMNSIIREAGPFVWPRLTRVTCRILTISFVRCGFSVSGSGGRPRCGLKRVGRVFRTLGNGRGWG
jgi:hypothetical protein